MEILKKTKELLANLVDVTEAGSKIARYKIEVANLDRKLGLAFRQIGSKFYRLHKEGNFDMGEDPEVLLALKDVKKIRARMEVIHQEVKGAKEKASVDWDRASRVVKEEAGRASDAVKKEASRAATMIKDERKRASEAIKKAKGGKKAAPPAKQPAARKPAVKKPAAKKPAAKKPAAKKPAAKKPAARKPAAKSPSKKGPAGARSASRKK